MVVPCSRSGYSPLGPPDESGGMAREPHRFDGMCLDPADDIGVVDGREEYVGHSNRVGGALSA